MKIAIILALFLINTRAFAQHETSGGGGAAVCRDPKTQKIVSASLYDLYEGKVKQGYTYSDPKVYPKTQVLAALSKMAKLDHGNFDYFFVIEEAKTALEHLRFLPEGTRLRPSEDFGKYAIPVPEGCELEGVGYYESDGTLWVAPGVYRAFSNLDQAAFLVHEAIYKIARETVRAKDSGFSRMFTAAIFSQQATLATLTGLREKVIYHFYEPLNFGPLYYVIIPGGSVETFTIQTKTNVSEHSISIQGVGDGKNCVSRRSSETANPGVFYEDGKSSVDALLTGSSCSYINADAHEKERDSSQGMTITIFNRGKVLFTQRSDTPYLFFQIAIARAFELPELPKI